MAITAEQGQGVTDVRGRPHRTVAWRGHAVVRLPPRAIRRQFHLRSANSYADRALDRRPIIDGNHLSAGLAPSVKDRHQLTTRDSGSIPNVGAKLARPRDLPGVRVVILSRIGNLVVARVINAQKARADSHQSPGSSHESSEKGKDLPL